MLLLEISRPTDPTTSWHTMSVYLGWVVPLDVAADGKRRCERSYADALLLETIDQCVAPEVITQAMANRRWVAQVRCVCRIYSGMTVGGRAIHV